jgi:hypothetical protein
MKRILPSDAALTSTHGFASAAVANVQSSGSRGPARSTDAAWLNELISGALLVALCAKACGVSGLVRPRRRTVHRQSAGQTPAIIEPVGSGS